MESHLVSNLGAQQNTSLRFWQLVKNPPAMWETWVQSLGWEDAQEEGIATHSNRASLVSQKVKNLPAIWEIRVESWVGKIHWRREWLSTPVFWPGEFHGQRSLAGYSPWGCKELDTNHFHKTSQPNIKEKI